MAPGTASVTVDCTPYYTTSLKYTYENHASDDSRLARSAKLLWNDVSTDFISYRASFFTATFYFQANRPALVIHLSFSILPTVNLSQLL